MIAIVITDARITKATDGWHVVHPSNGAILAYCTTEDEAERVRYTLARLADLLPPTMPEPITVAGHDVKPGDQLVAWKLDSDAAGSWRKIRDRVVVESVGPHSGNDPTRRRADCGAHGDYTLTGYMFHVIRKGTGE